MSETNDPERALWVPGRRRFLFLGLGAAVAALLPGTPAPWVDVAPKLAVIPPPVFPPDYLQFTWLPPPIVPPVIPITLTEWREVPFVLPSDPRPSDLDQRVVRETAARLAQSVDDRLVALAVLGLREPRDHTLLARLVNRAYENPFPDFTSFVRTEK